MGVKRQHEEDIKEINQNMIVRVKASKDIKRLTDERNAAMQEYSLIMSERDTFHKDMEKLQDEVQESRKAKKVQEEDRRKFTCQIEMLKREVRNGVFCPFVLKAARLVCLILDSICPSLV